MRQDVARQGKAGSAAAAAVDARHATARWSAATADAAGGKGCGRLRLGQWWHGAVRRRDTAGAARQRRGGGGGDARAAARHGSSGCGAARRLQWCGGSASAGNGGTVTVTHKTKR